MEQCWASQPEDRPSFTVIPLYFDQRLQEVWERIHSHVGDVPWDSGEESSSDASLDDYAENIIYKLI